MQHGFDKFSIPAKDFERILKTFHIDKKPVTKKYALGFFWEGDILIVTSHNPFKGSHYKNPHIQIGSCLNYCGYVGLECFGLTVDNNIKLIKKAVRMFRKYGDPGGESIGKRDFI